MRHTLTFLLVSLTITSGIFAQDYILVWEDNFDGTTLDSSKWNIEEKEGIWNTGDNRELEHYKKENVTVGDDGDGNNCLILTAIKETHKGYPFTSGKVTTKGKFAFKRGKMEASIKVPDLKNGLWPAFWTLGYTPQGWPHCGEIDVLEMGHAQAIAEDTVNSFVGAHLFWGNDSPGFPNAGDELTTPYNLSEDYYKHTVIWDESTIEVYFDTASSPYMAINITSDQFEEFRDYQHYVLFNLAVGGAFTGIYEEGNITAPLPASMYVDYVRVYQETGSEDYNDSSLALFGDIGVYEEKAPADISFTKGFDLFESTTGVTPRAGETPYEGSEALSYDATNGQPFDIKLSSAIARNFSDYSGGSLQFFIKTTIADTISVAVSDTNGNTHTLEFHDGYEFNFTRDGSWQLVFMPLLDSTGTLDLNALEDLLIIEAIPSADGYISIDRVIYRETMPSTGLFAIAADNSLITDKFIVDNVTGNLFIWNNTVAFNDAFPAYEGENVLSFSSTGAEAWFGYGFHSSTPVNLQQFSDGYLNISMRTEVTDSYYIAMDDHNGNTGEVNFVNGSDPYGFIRDGEWHHLQIPVSALTTQGLDLTNVQHVFMTGGDGQIGDIAYDNIYLSEDSDMVQNPDICFLSAIAINPANKVVSVGETAQFKATVTNQFGNAYDKDIEWTSNGGTIDQDGNFSSDVTGEYVVTASQEGVEQTANVTVSNATGLFTNTTANDLKAHYNALNDELIIGGLTEGGKIMLVSIGGRVIVNREVPKGSNQIEISMTGQQPGIYLVRAISRENHYVTKLVKH